jgi:hypothetical protein
LERAAAHPWLASDVEFVAYLKWWAATQEGDG